MKIGLVLPSVGNETWQAYRAILALKKAVEDAGHEPVMYSPQKIMLSLNGEKVLAFEGGEPLLACDVLFTRVFFHEEMPAARVLVNHLASQGTKIVNEGFFRLTDEAKFFLMSRLAEGSIQIPKTLFIARKTDLSHLGNELSYPFVMKILDGTGGKGVVFIESEKSLLSVLDLYWLNNSSSPVLLQEYISESHGSDRRLFVAGDRVVAAMERTSKGQDFRSNLHSGGGAVKIEPTEMEKESAVAAARCLGLDIAGVDLLVSKKGPLVIDVNPNPGILKTSAATGVDIAAEIVQFIVRFASA